MRICSRRLHDDDELDLFKLVLCIYMLGDVCGTCQSLRYKDSKSCPIVSNDNFNHFGSCNARRVCEFI